MKLQFAFGNPRRGKKKLARGSKNDQTDGHIDMLQSHGGRMRRKRKSHGRKVGRRNPTETQKVAKAKAALLASPLGSKERASARKRLAHMLKSNKANLAVVSKAKEPEQIQLSDAERKAMGLKPRKKSGRKSVAKKRGKKRASAKRGKKRAVKKAVRRRKRSRRKLHSHSSKQRHIKKGQKFKVSMSSGGRRLSGSVKANPRRKKKRAYAKRRTHKHRGKVHHVKKGSRFRVVAKRKGLKLSGVATMNPRRKRRKHSKARHVRRHRRHRRHSFGRNPMADVKKYLGMSGQEMAALAAGGALVPIVNSLASSYLGMIVNPINSILGPMATGSVIPILIGGALNAVAEHAVKSGKGHDILKLAGEGLAAAGLVSLASSFSQQYIKPALGLSGVLYVPNMSGIKYTPSSMAGIRYTPMSGMGVMPQLGAGYTEAHHRSPADFGRGADFGGMGGADFGGDGTELSEDSDIDVAYDPEDILDSAMG